MPPAVTFREPAANILAEMTRLDAKHPRAIRWFHWINFPLLSLMIWSGALIYWSNDVYRIGIGNLTLFHFFPDWFYNLTGIDHRLAEGMAWHFVFMWLVRRQRRGLRALHR